jgi:erythromycin esterase-like protein
MAFALSVSLNRYVKKETDALTFGKEFPTWMWDNLVTRAFLDWCREQEGSIEIVGLDLYQEALSRKQLEEQWKPQVPGADKIVEEAMEKYSNKEIYLNALVIQNAERYKQSQNSWNVRDEHMHQVMQYLMMNGAPNSRMIVFAHNSHCCDYRATSHAEQGQISLGQLVKEDIFEAAFIVLQSTFSGQVRAAADWGQESQEWTIEKPASNSLSYFLHQCEKKDFVLDLRNTSEVRKLLNVPMSSRAIGVVYKQGNENLSHYFEAVHSQGCDAIIHFDETTALKI